MAKLLVVDDEKNLRLVVQKEMARQGHDVETASDGEAAWEILESRDFDVLLCDINMPRLDGMGLLRRVCEKSQNPPEVIMLTGQGTVETAIESMKLGPVGLARFARYDELYGYAWWAASRFVGYVLVPLPLWKLMFPEDKLLDMGLRGRGFFSHAWIYGLCLAVVIPVMLIVAREPDFGSYYPFYKQSSRSYFDWFCWEAMYFLQFFALELFFRGWMLGALRRSLGSSAIFAMALPYCMIHYGKPYLEANGAIIAGIALGSLSMKTKSIYQGFLVHITVAGLMDWLALSHRDALPHVFWPPEVDPTTGLIVQQKEIPPSTVVHWVVGVLSTLIVGIALWRGYLFWKKKRAEKTPPTAPSDGLSA